jgi:hypothetical protein
MSQIAIPSSSLEFKTREYYVENTPSSTAKGDTLTFEELDKTLLFLSQSISTSEGFYSSSFPDGTETPKAVGGINSGSTAGQFRGKSFSYMFDALLFPVISPAGTAGLLNASISPSIDQEIGDTITVTLSPTFNRGTWTVAGQSNRYYYGAASSYEYTSSIYDTNNTNGTFNNYDVTSGTNGFTTKVNYGAGDQPVYSNGENSGSAIPPGQLTTTDSFTGVYPWFYGSSSTAITANQVTASIENIYNSISTNAVKKVESSVNTVTAIYPNYTSPFYCWFAIPSGSAYSTPKTLWFETDSSKGAIGGPTNTFGSPITLAIDTFINNVNYNIYITNYDTVFAANGNGYVQLRNS